MSWQGIERRIGKPALFIVCIGPFLSLLYLALTDALGADPVKALIVETGEWSLWLLIATLTLSPLRQWFGLARLLRYRRMLGVFTFFYGSVHLLIVGTYLFGWDWVIFQEELSERPHVIAGFSAWMLMLPLALTSTNYAVRKLRQNWRVLHRLVYPAAGLAWLHLAWQTRASYFDAVVYGLIIFCLLFQRLKKSPKSG